MITFYRCDPDKNSECSKKSCVNKKKVFPCKCTSNPDFAMKDKSGNPIIAFIHFDDKPPLLVDGGADW